MDELLIKVPATMVLSGASFSGKSYFLKRLIKSKLFDRPIDNIYYCYGTWCSDYENMPEIKFVEGVPEDVSFMFGSGHNLVCFDDLQDQITQTVVNIFTKDSHHRNLSCVLILQNLFLDSKFCRTIALNSHYTVLFRNPRAASQYRILASQTGQKHLMKAFEDAMSLDRFGYLFIDSSPHGHPHYRLRTRIFPGEDCVVYH